MHTNPLNQPVITAYCGAATKLLVGKWGWEIAWKSQFQFNLSLSLCFHSPVWKGREGEDVDSGEDLGIFMLNEIRQRQILYMWNLNHKRKKIKTD